MKDKNIMGNNKVIENKMIEGVDDFVTEVREGDRMSIPTFQHGGTVIGGRTPYPHHISVNTELPKSCEHKKCRRELVSTKVGKMFLNRCYHCGVIIDDLKGGQ